MAVQRMTLGLGTFVTLEAGFLPSFCPGTEILDSACDAIARFHRSMSPQEDGSDVVAIGRAGVGELVAVAPETFRVLHLALQIGVASGGLFDACLLDRPGRLGDLELVSPSSVRVHAPVLLDLGGIAKGVAVDAAVECLRAAGAVAGIVNAGGDLRVFGRPREISVDVAGRDARVILEDGALAVSGPRTDRSPSGHRGLYSPRTGLAVPSPFVAVRAPTAGVADALTKCAALCAPDELAGLLERFDAALVPLEPAG